MVSLWWRIICGIGKEINQKRKILPFICSSHVHIKSHPWAAGDLLPLTDASVELSSTKCGNSHFWFFRTPTVMDFTVWFALVSWQTGVWGTFLVSCPLMGFAQIPRVYWKKSGTGWCTSPKCCKHLTTLNTPVHEEHVQPRPAKLRLQLQSLMYTPKRRTHRLLLSKWFGGGNGFSKAAVWFWWCFVPKK